jgi:hypothetical protein
MSDVRKILDHLAETCLSYKAGDEVYEFLRKFDTEKQENGKKRIVNLGGLIEDKR